MKMTTSFIMQAMLVCIGVFGMAAAVNAKQCPKKPTLKINAHTLDFSEKKPVCVVPGGTFVINLKAQGGFTFEYDDVTVRSKDGSNKFSKLGVNSNGDMTVKANVSIDDTDLGYEINVAGVGTLDPRVRIINNFLPLKKNFPEVQDYLLEEYELSLASVAELDQELHEMFGIRIVDILRAIEDGASSQ